MAFYSDVDIEHTRQADGDVQIDEDTDAIFNSISNIILTRQGERRMLPTFASNVKHLLFEPIDEITARLVGENIVDALRVWETRINIEKFDIEPLFDSNAYRCRLGFSIVGSEDKIKTIDFILSR